MLFRAGGTRNDLAKKNFEKLVLYGVFKGYEFNV